MLFWEWHPCAAKPGPPIRMSAHASFFGETLATHRAVPRPALFLASMLDPKLLALMIPSLGTLNKPQWRLLWGKPEGVFYDSIPGENGVGLRFRAEFFNIFNTTRTSATPNNTLNSPLLGRSTQTLASSLGSGGANGGFNPLYQIGGARSIQLALKLQF